MFIALTLFTYSALACVDLSGRYQFPTPPGEEQDVTIITQEGCSAISMNGLRIITDNEIHKVFEEDILIEGQVAGHVTISAKGTFRANELFLDQYIKMEMLGQFEETHVTSVNTLLGNGDLQSVQKDEDTGEIITIIGKRL